MAKSKKAIIEEVAECLGWRVSFQTQRSLKCNDGKWDKEVTEKYIELSIETPHGGEFCCSEFYNRLEEIPERLYERYQDFDVDEEVKMYLEAKENGLAGVPDAQGLVHDAEWEEAALLELSDSIRDAFNGKWKPKEPEPPKHEQLLEKYNLRCRFDRNFYYAWETADQMVKDVYGASIFEVLRRFDDLRR